MEVADLSTPLHILSIYRRIVAEVYCSTKTVDCDISCGIAFSSVPLMGEKVSGRQISLLSSSTELVILFSSCLSCIRLSRNRLTGKCLSDTGRGSTYYSDSTTIEGQ